MNSKDFLNDKSKRIISGNTTQTDPNSDVISYYQGYAPTAFNDKTKTPENKVKSAKNFVDENHK